MIAPDLMTNPTPEQLDAIRASLKRTFFRGWTEEYFASPSFPTDLDAHAIKRFEECRDVILPWIETYMPLAGKRVVDFGCGTGASTAAWALRAQQVIGYDIHAPSIEAARERMQILGFDHVRVEHLEPAEILTRMRADAASVAGEGGSGGVDAIILYAVLEHQTISERIDTLKACWEVLTPGGLLVVGDSPSRFSIFDYHTSSLPFFQWMPDELCVRYAERSPRAELREGVATTLRQGGMPAAIEFFQRSGRAVGYEEFELALGDLQGLVVGDSYDDCMVKQPVRAVTIGDEIAAFAAGSAGASIPRGFLRPSLEVILRKPRFAGDLAPPKPEPPLRGLVLRAPTNAPAEVGRNQATIKPDGTCVLEGAGAYIEYKLPDRAASLRIDVLKHPWSASIRVRTAEGQVVHTEDLHAEQAKRDVLAVAIPSGSTSVRIELEENPRSLGLEAWIHSVRTE